MISVGILVVCTVSLSISIYETVKKYLYDAKNPIPHKLSPADAESVADLVIKVVGEKVVSQQEHQSNHNFGKVDIYSIATLVSNILRNEKNHDPINSVELGMMGSSSEALIKNTSTELLDSRNADHV